MNKVLYRKYRPQNFDDVVGQNHIIKTIKNSIKRNRISHAYLFSGPRGVGKTTIARILAKTINCENQNKHGESCNICKICKSANQGSFLDIVEIDAATHTQVDKIRDLIDKIDFSPSLGKYKVYIIDEVHMLSKGAFNALLKTLEEPPTHAVFILATTEIHKVPATIISRCQRFDFKRLKVSEIKNCLSEIAAKEKLNVEKGVFELIAENSDGGLRDSESLFGQIISLGDRNITLKEAQYIIGVADSSSASFVAKLLIEKKFGKAIDYINKMADNGYDLEQFAKLEIEYFRKLLLVKISSEMKNKFLSEMTEEQVSDLALISEKISISKIVKIIRLLISGKNEIKSSILPQLPLELAIFEIDILDSSIAYNEKDDLKTKEMKHKKEDEICKNKDQLQKFERKNNCFVKTAEIKVENQECDNFYEKSQNKQNKSFEVSEEENYVNLESIKNKWSNILENAKSFNHSLSLFLKVCCPVNIEKNQLTISCKYSFHKNKLCEIENKSVVEKLLLKAFGVNIFVKFITNDEAKEFGYKIEESKDKNNAGVDGNGSKNKDDLINSALEMFGGEIV